MKKWQIALVGILIVAGLFLLDGGSVYIKQLINRPPKAAFSFQTSTRTLKYIAPTDRDLIIFTNESTDPETPLEKLISNWYVRYNGTGDWKLLNSSTHHWGRLPVSNGKGHEIRLVVSDAMKEDSTSILLPVDLGSRYPTRILDIPVKGIMFNIGYRNLHSKPVSETEMAESLDVIRNGLNCNALIIYGDFEEALVQCGRLASDKFQIVVLAPIYRSTSSKDDITIEQYTEKIIAFSQKAEAVRRSSNFADVILCVGNELVLETSGIINGSSYSDRHDQLAEFWRSAASRERLNYCLKKVVDGVRVYFHGKITYKKLGGGDRGGGGENVKWNELGFDIVGSNEYVGTRYWTELQELKAVRDLKTYGKPVFITEFGTCSYVGATKNGGSAAIRYSNESYSQEEQVNCIVQNLRLYQLARVDGVFLHVFLNTVVNDAATFGILKYSRDGFYRRKLGFYAYQSFVVAA